VGGRANPPFIVVADKGSRHKSIKASNIIAALIVCASTKPCLLCMQKTGNASMLTCACWHAEACANYSMQHSLQHTAGVPVREDVSVQNTKHHFSCAPAGCPVFWVWNGQHALSRHYLLVCSNPCVYPPPPEAGHGCRASLLQALGLGRDRTSQHHG
jgi:hypothetical protein